MADLIPTRVTSADWARRLALLGVCLGLIVVTLGAYVRLTAAGLGCPDWPGCYGHFSPLGAQANATITEAFPHAPLDVGKAWREMIHRYAASLLGLIIVIIAAISIATKRRRVVGRGFALSLLALVIFQGALGMLTVTWQLKPLIVTGHLVFGFTTVAMLWWLWLSLRRTAVVREGARAARTTRRWIAVALAMLAVQVALGGWTSSNYAAVACPDFPTCQNQWLPDTDFQDAFVLWRGLGINYEGGVLNHPARVAIHFTHRLGAVLATLLLLLAVVKTFRTPALTHARGAAVAVVATLGLQLAIGISMVLRAFPLGLATAHNAGAILLLLATVLLYFSVRPRTLESAVTI